MASPYTPRLHPSGHQKLFTYLEKVMALPDTAAATRSRPFHLQFQD